jgi:transcriptional regulator with AAA-type ATPase domain
LLKSLFMEGKAEPVSAWEVVTAREARSRLEVKAERGLTALVGREREMAALWDCFEKARAGQGQMVFIVGEPGIGKSRLVESNNDHAISQFAA